ncbi:MAG: tetratricopeptide repeat protein [Alphaproteobacteria bacterium]
MKEILIFLTCLIGLCKAEAPDGASVQDPAPRMMIGNGAYEQQLRRQLIEARLNPQTPAGNYLAARFAQRHHDWKAAAGYVNQIAKQMPEDLNIQKRAMVLAMGAGAHEKAVTIAKQVIKSEPENALAAMFVAMEAFQAEDFNTASKIVRDLPDGSFSSFITPLLHSWAQASIGIFDTGRLQNNAIHIYHGILIADLLGQDEAVSTLLAGALKMQNMTTLDLERIGDVYAHIDAIQDARNIYTKILELDPENISVEEKLATLDTADRSDMFEAVDNAAQGMARTMFDMARLLYSDYSDESAKIFGQMALYLNPAMPEARLLLGSIAARNGQPDLAIAHFDGIGATDKHYFEARRKAADLLEEQGRTEDALVELQALVTTHDDTDALLQIGDVYRRAEDFKKAVQAYSKVEKKFDGDVPEEFWQLYYVRGMSYEQLDKWDKAEKDLLKALEYYPEHPFVLNYLGYSWADQGVHLARAQEMIRKAVALRPQDGYITDSLGWVLYRLGKYEEAIPHLERAVELLPYDPIINDHLGDAYWQVGRRREARFQWTRAKNHGDEEEMLATIADKMVNGVVVVPLEAATAQGLDAPAIEEALD